MSRSLQARLHTLRELAELAPGRVPPDVLARIEATAQRAVGRVAHGTAKTVAALAGATGSGKSSILNVLAATPVAAVGVRRPTTSTTQAVAFSADGTLDAEASSLLDWLGVADRNVVADGQLDGLILLDLPDHDSSVAAHRQEVDRLVQVVDVFVWIVDPQKYADAVLHQDYLQRFTGHADITMVILNQLDTISRDNRGSTLDDLTRLLRDDGLAVAGSGLLSTLTRRTDGVRVFGASVRTGEGMAEIRNELAARAAERRAMTARIQADLDWIATDVTSALGDRAPGPIDHKAVHELEAALARAVGADGISEAVASSHQRSGRVAVGWPPTRWLTRLRPDPLRRLGLGRRPTSRAERDRPAPVPTSLPPRSTVADAAVSAAIRTLAERAGAGLPEPWRHRIAETANSRKVDLDDALDRAVASVELPASRPAWWRLVGLLQWLLAAAMAVGFVWLIALAVFAWLQLPDLPTPHLGALPWPTLLGVGGALAGIVVGSISGSANAVSARRRAHQARTLITQGVRGVAHELVVAPVDAELEALRRVHALGRALQT